MTATDKFVIIPKATAKKTKKKIADVLNVELIEATLADSSLIGIFSFGNSKGIVVPKLVEQHEVDYLNSIGIKVLQIDSNLALGNLAEANDKVGFCNILAKKQIEEIEKFLGIKIYNQQIANSDLIGASLVLTNKAFAVNPNTNANEFKRIQTKTSLEGKVLTANFGDVFIAHSLVANSNGVLVGEATTGPEIMQIYDLFGE
ncbi:MAG: translation initiation factor IF-6 [Candidatus Diapherotrites archaeon]|nr:translation initiation factor IF-6 [Candidatus Diapherotrites archaeon]